MKRQRINITLPPDLIERVDSLRSSEGLSRSDFLQAAAELLLSDRVAIDQAFGRDSEPIEPVTLIEQEAEAVAAAYRSNIGPAKDVNWKTIAEEVREAYPDPKDLAKLDRGVLKPLFDKLEPAEKAKIRAHGSELSTRLLQEGAVAATAATPEAVGAVISRASWSAVRAYFKLPELVP